MMKAINLRFAVASLAMAVSGLGVAPLVYAQSSNDFDLVCYGVGEKLESHYDYDWDSKHHEYKERSSLGTAQVGGSVQVEIHNGEGRLRLPKEFLPALTSGGDHGWFPIRDLSIGDEQIRGSLKINGLNKPGLTIDRRSGRLKLDGLQTFEGNCNAFNPGSTKF